MEDMVDCEFRVIFLCKQENRSNNDALNMINILLMITGWALHSLKTYCYSNAILNMQVLSHESRSIAVKAMAFLTFTAHNWSFLEVVGSSPTQGRDWQRVWKFFSFHLLYWFASSKSFLIILFTKYITTGVGFVRKKRQTQKIRQKIILLFMIMISRGGGFFCERVNGFF